MTDVFTPMFLPYTVMLAVDIAVIVAAIGISLICWANRDLIRQANAGVGLSLLLAGMFTVAVLYAADLNIITLRPLQIGMMAAMREMSILHTSYSWYIYILGILLAVAGTTVSIRSFGHQLKHLEEARFQGVLIQRDDMPLFANQALANTFGYDSPEEILALSSVGELKAEHEQERLKQYSMALLRNESAPVRYEFEGLRKDGTSIWLENFVTVVIWNGEPAVQSTTVNITKRRRAEEALKARERELQERLLELEQSRHAYKVQGTDLANRVEELSISHQQLECAKLAQSQFLADMSHELRTPLNAIMGFSKIMQQESFGPIGSPQYREYAGDIFGAGQHLLNLINDILDISKIEAGAEDLHEEDIDVDEFVQSALRLVRLQAKQGGVNLEVDIRDKLQVLHADERKLKQILVNLINNAIKFTEAGGKVTLKVWCRAESGYVFQIVDTGIGIAPKDIPKALSRFGQVESDHNRKHQGTGLGLPLSKILTEMHGGVLDLQSRVGVGTTVTVRLPAERIVASLDVTQSLSGAVRKAS